MAADLHIHILEGITEVDLRDFFTNTLGSKYFGQGNSQRFMDLFQKISETPNIWIGEVSWLKAGLTNDAKTFIPDPVQKVKDLIGENLPVLDEKLLKEIVDALNIPNDTEYSVAEPMEVEEFLRPFIGSQLFTVSW